MTRTPRTRDWSRTARAGTCSADSVAKAGAAMAMGKRKSEQTPMWVPTTELPVSPGHPFYAKLNAILDEASFDRFAETECQQFYAPVMGRPSLPPGRYFRLLLVGYFEGLDSERGIAWRAADSLAVRQLRRARPGHGGAGPLDHFADAAVDCAGDASRGLHLGAGAPGGGRLAEGANGGDRRDHARGQRRHAQYRPPGHGRDVPGVSDPARDGVRHQDADARGPGAAGSAAEEADLEHRLAHPSDPDAKITKMKDGRTHLAHKAEHAIDLDSGALVAVTLHGADVGDTTQSRRHGRSPRSNRSAAAQAGTSTSGALTELVADKGYHSNQTMIDLRRHRRPVVHRRAESGPAPVDDGPGRATGRVRQSAARARRARPAVAASTRGVRGAVVRARLRHGRDAPHALARASQHPQTPAGSRERLQSRPAHAATVCGRGTPRGLQGRRLDARSLHMALLMLSARLWMTIGALLAHCRRPLARLASSSGVGDRMMTGATSTTGC